MLRSLPIAVLLAASAAGAQDRTALLLSDAPAPERRKCEILPRAPRPYAAALDSAGLAAALAADPEQGVSGTALYSVRWGEDGQVAWVRKLEGTLPEAAEARVQGMVRAHARAARADDPWSARVRVTLGGAAPEVRIGRSEVCRVASAEATARPSRPAPPGGGSSRDPRSSQSSSEVRVRVRVGTAGDVLEVRPGGAGMTGDQAAEIAREGRYLPELVDGVPVPAWFDLRVRFRTVSRVVP